jgi:hypothetical protein
MAYWTNEKTIVKVGSMCDAQGNQKRPSKYGRGGKTLVEALLVRISCRFMNLSYVLLLVCVKYGFTIWLGVGVCCKNKLGLRTIISCKFMDLNSFVGLCRRWAYHMVGCGCV